MTARFNLPLPYGWFALCPSSELNVGDVEPLKYFEQDLVLFRTESGEAKVIHAICPHLGAHIGHGGKVKGESVACPFHGWEFNGDGMCTDVPYAKNIPPKVKNSQCIPSFPTVEKNGFVYVWYHPNSEAPLFEVDDIPETESEEWEIVESQSWVLDCPVQESAENAVDKAHFKYVHDTPDVPDAEVTIEGHRRRTLLDAEMTEFGPGEDGKFPRIHLVSESVGAGLTFQRFTGMFETVLMGLVTPITADSSRLRFVFLQPKQKSDGEAMLAQAFYQEICRQVEQDMPIWTHKHYQPKPILCDGDGPIAQFRRWFSQFYAEPAAQNRIA